ncbi:phosphate ABC transporter substrate-binding protein [Clostridium vincentii]|uniref:Phosphate-binding protein n=1 Tax=Clostridium vincentii TaxID=52704 RepID=A0A2T0BJX1_9CLOT|nr:phosphate ABC transporter substrate-binding protein [Clostridium vincentii]PRR84123.1 Phosphate-binding protein PstS 1 precursor [Clostridium vincentii]
MKKRNLKLIVGMLVVTMVGGAFVGCGSKESTGEEQLINISGSSAIFPLMEKSIEGFNAKNPDYTINAQAGGSGTGLTQVLEGTVNIGNSDIFAEEKLDEAKAKELVDHQVVAQGFAVAVSKNLGVTNLTKDQIGKIFSGQVKNWNEVGGPDKEILVIHRPASSGTRATFVKTVLGGDKALENDAIGATQDANGSVKTAMEQNDGAISYLGLAYLQGDAKDTLTGVAIDGVTPEKANITTGKYVFWSWGHMYTKGEATGLSKTFIDYVLSSDNVEAVEELGFISGSEMKVK